MSGQSLVGRRGTPAENWAIGMLAGIALLTFFFPLISMHVPIAGDQTVSGYDIVSKINNLRQSLTTPSGGQIQLPQPPPQSDLGLPLSVRIIWLLPVLIIATFGCALLALLGSWISLKASKTASAVGAVCGLGGIVYLTILNSDVHTIMQQAMTNNATDLKDTPFAGLAQTLGNLMVGAFQVKAGTGLCTLVICLAAIALIAHFRILSRIRLADSP
jgi:hypothetical protein